jgi:hypothetical protein
MSREIFSRNLRNFIIAFDMSEEKFQKELHISYDRMHSWLVCKSYPKIDMIVKICDAFKFRDIYRLVTEKIPVQEIFTHAYNIRTKQPEQEEAAA